MLPQLTRCQDFGAWQLSIPTDAPNKLMVFLLLPHVFELQQHHPDTYIIASASVGCPSVPPARCVDNAPHMQASLRDLCNSQLFKYPYINPASNESPAPTVSATFTETESEWMIKSSLQASAPSEPSLMATSLLLFASCVAADSTSFTFVIEIASVLLGRKISVAESNSSKPTHCSDGS